MYKQINVANWKIMLFFWNNTRPCINMFPMYRLGGLGVPNIYINTIIHYNLILYMPQ